MSNLKYFLLFLGGVSFSSHAMVPVIDVGAIAHAASQIQQLEAQYTTMVATYENAKSQYDTLKNAYTTAKDQLKNLESLKNYNSGHYDWGTLKNGAKDLHDIQWSAGSWSDTLKNVAGGNSERYKSLVEAYKKAHPSLSDTEFKKGSTETKLVAYKETMETTSNADAQATTAYNNVNKHHESIHELSKKIEETDNSKSSMDLNSRLIAENAKIQTEMLKQLSILNKQAALKSSNELRETQEAAKFYTLPDQ